MVFSGAAGPVLASPARPMRLDIPIDIDDFRVLREAGLAYVDKSFLIREILDEPGAQVLLLPRPRRFGKTLNIGTLRILVDYSRAWRS